MVPLTVCEVLDAYVIVALFAVRVESAVAPVVVSDPEMRTLPVVVAPPLMVSPPLCVPAPMVVEAFDMNPAKVGVPVKTGLVEKTTLPVPVSSLKSEARSAEVAMELDASLLLKVMKSAEERKPDCPAVACWIERVEPEKLSGPLTVVDCATPDALVEMMVAGVLETVRLEVDAVPA